MTNKINSDAYQPYRGGPARRRPFMFAPCTPSAAQGGAAITSEFSAQQQQDKAQEESGPARVTRGHHARSPRERLARSQAARTATSRTVTSHRIQHAHSHAAKGNIARGEATESNIAHSHAAEKPLCVQSSNRKALRRWLARLAPVARWYHPPSLRALSRHAAREPLPRRACAGSRRVAPAALSLAAIITRRGEADTACVMAAAGGRLARSAPWARS